jgi:hypothetical protein
VAIQRRPFEAQGWVQPPGTPAIGLAFLAAWNATSNSLYLDAARETAHGLVRGQLRSGGWTYVIDLSPEGRRKYAYREGGAKDGRNTSTLDDDTTQCALRFLMQADEALGFRDTRIRESVEFALKSLLEAQYPNGAWPQGYERAPEPGQFPVKRASYPESWPRTWPGSEQYWQRYTLNDGSLATTVETLLEAARIYTNAAAGKSSSVLGARCRAAVMKAGDFILLAQMPDPQPAWAQQYDFEMHPSWARKFEPPAITGGESRDALRILLRLYRETGDRRFLEPIPSALEYFRRSRLPDGRLARFYELRTNRPLFFTRDYTLTHDDRDAPTHYSFKVPDWTDSIARDYERVLKIPVEQSKAASPVPAPKATPQLLAEVKAVIAAQDTRGRWVESGGMRFHRPRNPAVRVLNSATFIRNVETLSRYLAATRP